MEQLIVISALGTDRPGIVAAVFERYNDWLWDYCSYAPDRLMGLALIPLHDVELGMKEFERAVKKGYRGVCIPCTAPEERPYSDPVYDRFWAAAQDLGMPLSLHIGTSRLIPRARKAESSVVDAASNSCARASEISPSDVSVASYCRSSERYVGVRSTTPCRRRSLTRCVRSWTLRLRAGSIPSPSSTTRAWSPGTCT